MQENNENQEQNQNLNQNGNPDQSDSDSYSYGNQNVSDNYQYGQDSSGNFQYGQNTSGGYQQYSQYGQYERRDVRPGNGFGIASMILGILSLALFCACINIPLAIAAVVFGVLHLIRNPENKAFGIVGIVTAIISVVLFFVMVVLLVPRAYHEYREQNGIHQPYGFDDDDFDDDFDFDFEFPFSNDSGFDMPKTGGF